MRYIQKTTQLSGSAAEMVSKPPCMAMVTMQKTVEKKMTVVCTESVIITPHETIPYFV